MSVPAVSDAVHTPQPVDLAGESVAGEEDPGAWVEPVQSPPDTAGPGQQQGAPVSPSPMSPGDQASPGTPDTRETACPRCGGSGRVGNQPCDECGGTGKLIVDIDGA